MTPASRLYGGLFAALTLLLLVLARVAGLPWLAAYLAAVNLTTLLAYGYDKAAARADASGRRARVPERVLQVLALAGGSPGALLAQRLLRHKTAKVGFQRAYWLIVVVQAALLAYWLLRKLFW